MSETFGTEAETSAREHLVRGEVDDESRVEPYSCPDTGRRFLLEWPERTQADPGQARLRLVA